MASAPGAEKSWKGESEDTGTLSHRIYRKKGLWADHARDVTLEFRDMGMIDK
jgi:hypothetical protein